MLRQHTAEVKFEIVRQLQSGEKRPAQIGTAANGASNGLTLRRAGFPLPEARADGSGAFLPTHRTGLCAVGDQPRRLLPRTPKTGWFHILPL